MEDGSNQADGGMIELRKKKPRDLLRGKTKRNERLKFGCLYFGGGGRT
jgi:hypothetical protein